MSTKKHVLVAGLGRFVPAEQEVGSKLGIAKTNKQMVLDVSKVATSSQLTGGTNTSSQDLEKATQAGYQCSSLDVNPDQPEESLRQIKERLQSRQYDLFIVGFGLRGNPVCPIIVVAGCHLPTLTEFWQTFTSLFENVVNTCVELSPKTKLGFSPTPNGMYQTILRMLS